MGVTKYFPNEEVNGLKFHVKPGQTIGFRKILAICLTDLAPWQIVCPVHGEIVEVNKQLEEHFSLANLAGQDAWLLKVKDSLIDTGLMSEKEYKEYRED